MSDTEKRVDCERHGASHATFLCGHLMDGVGFGFNAGFDEEHPHDPRPDAWCDDCEAVRARAGGWDDESTPKAEISLACAGCYDEVRRRETGPRVDRDGWALRNALAHDEAMPPLEQRAGLAVGDAAQVVFELPASVERMWVVVSEPRETGVVGLLENEPHGATPLRRGERVEFGPEHVVAVTDVPEDHLRALGVR